MRNRFLLCLQLALTWLYFAAAACGVEAVEPRAAHVVFLGTGAADIQWPEKDSSPKALYIREHAGRNVRRYSSLFVSPGVVIDYALTGREGLEAAGIAPSAIECVLITHSHGDHFQPAAIVDLAREKAAALTVVGNSAVVTRMQEHLEGLSTAERPAMTLRTVKPFEEFDVGRWRAKALAANHMPNEEALLYVLRNADKSLLYATDTGWFPVGTFAALRGEKLDLAIVEATFGEEVRPNLLTGHMNLPFVRLVKQFLIDGKGLKPKGRFAVTHLSLRFCEPYDQLAPKLAEEDILVAYDGLRMEL